MLKPGANPWACHLSRLPLSLWSPPVASISSSSFWTPVCCLKTAQQAVPPIQPWLCYSSLVSLWKRIHASLLCGHQVSVTLAPRWTYGWAHTWCSSAKIPRTLLPQSPTCWPNLSKASQKGLRSEGCVLHLTALHPSPLFIIPPVGKAGFTLWLSFRKHLRAYYCSSTDTSLTLLWKRIRNNASLLCGHQLSYLSSCRQES